jgi:hypothetical protein
MAGEDFVMVQLSQDGIAAAKGGPITISNGRRSFTFSAGVAQRVERSYEWNGVLSRQVAPDGKKLFELAPPAVPAPAAAAPTTQPENTTAAPAVPVEEKK